MSDHDVLWTPPADIRRCSRIGAFMQWLADHKAYDFDSYDALWEWSTEDLAGFWGAVKEYSGTHFDQAADEVVQWSEVSNARWFRGATLNYAKELLRAAPNGEIIVGLSQSRPRVTWSRDVLHEQVARCRVGLVRLGVGKGDRVAGYIPNVPEAIAAFLATATLGAIWTSCPPEFGARSVVERLRQVEPKVLIAVDGYRYGDQPISLLDRVAEIIGELPSLEASVLLPYLDSNSTAGACTETWANFTAHNAPLAFESVPFDYPLYILYSSGTTGLPKAIIHGHGGILLEHFKNLALHLDIGTGDRFFWFSTTGWMMWNLLISGLLAGSAIVTFDGNPAFGGQSYLWKLAESEALSFFGISATFLSACQNEGMDLRAIGDFKSLRGIGSTGSTLSAHTARWVYEQLPARVHLGSGSGGTDICSAFVGAVLMKPVWADAMSCRYLGAKVEAFDESGNSLIGAMGELVISRPMPSMPVALWGDPDGSRLRSAYFDFYPGRWRHGDWITVRQDGSCTIHGRSDATLNRGGVRLGSAEFYALLETLPEVRDSLIVHIEDAAGGMGELILFVVPRGENRDPQALSAIVRRTIRAQLSPRHVPDTIYFVSAVPRTLSGKKLEVPVKQILRGVAPAKVMNTGALADASALGALLEIYHTRQSAPIERESLS